MLNLEPKIIWDYFEKLLSIPRCSKNEEKIRAFLIKNAENKSIRYKADDTGNIIYYLNATCGMEHKKRVILQAHMDMVCNKINILKHDFLEDPIIPRVENDYMSASGTTLGADNGIGVAIMLSIPDDSSFEHGPLELLFTSDEETGLFGAFGLDKSLLKGKMLINLDFEELGCVCIGSAGGADIICRFPIRDKINTDNMLSYRILLKGLKGGHSGIDIHLGRGNAIVSCIKFLSEIIDDLPETILLSIEGGSQKNAIPRECFMYITIEAKHKEKLEHIIKQKNLTGIKNEPDATFSMQEINDRMNINRIGTKLGNKNNLIDAFLLIPNNVISMSSDITDFVETSNNIGLIKTTQDAIIVTCHARSCDPNEIFNIYIKIKTGFESFGGSVVSSSPYPGWKPDLNSALLKLACGVWENIYEKQPIVKAVHAGLECGVFKEKIDDLDVVSIGPQIENPHSPLERVKISSVAYFYNYLKKLINSI